MPVCSRIPSRTGDMKVWRNRDGRRGRPWPLEREGPAPEVWEGFTGPDRLCQEYTKGTFADNRDFSKEHQLPGCQPFSSSFRTVWADTTRFAAS